MGVRRLLYACLILSAMFAIAATERFPATTVPQTQTAAPLATVSASTTQSTPDMYSVEKVVDGDTIDILMNGKKERMRLIGLDTPEVVDPRKVVQCFGKEASAKAHEMLDGKSVSVETDASQGERDKYGRLLAYLYLDAAAYDSAIRDRVMQSHMLFNEYMIAEGYGHEYTYRYPYKYQKQFKAAEKSAREAVKGLWAPETCGGNTKHPAIQ